VAADSAKLLVDEREELRAGGERRKAGEYSQVKGEDGA